MRRSDCRSPATYASAATHRTPPRARTRSQYEVGLGELTDAPVGLPIASHVRLRAIHCAIGEYQRRAVVASRSIERGQILLIEGGLLSTIRNAGLYGSARVNRGQ